MRNPTILNLSILLIIINFNLLASILPSSLSLNELRINSDNTDSWVKLIDPGGQIFKPNMRWVNNHIYFVGQIQNSDSNDYSIYLAKYNNTGLELWEKKWDTSLNEKLSGFELDSYGNIIILGTQGTWSFEQPESIILLKYSLSGELLWSKTLNTSHSCAAYAIKLDQDDNIYIAGGAMKEVVFHKFLYKLNSTGAIQWYNQIDLRAQQLEIDSNNNVYAYGNDSNGFKILYKLNSTGSILWSIDLGQYNDVSSMKFDSNQDVLITGERYYYDNDSIIMWVSKYNSSGALMNKLEFMLQENDWFIHGKTWLIKNNLYIFINYPQTPNSCLLKFNNSFQLEWNATLNKYYFPAYYYNLDSVIDVDSHDNTTFCYENPRNEYTSDIGIILRNSLDISILKLDSSGEIFSHYYWGGSNQDTPIQIFIDPANDVYLLCKCEYVDNWGGHKEYYFLTKNPEINGSPPGLGLVFGFNDYYIFSFLGFMSVISIILLISIIKPKLKRIREI